MIEPLLELNVEISFSLASTTQSLAGDPKSKEVAGDPAKESEFAEEGMSVGRYPQREVSMGKV